MAELKKRIILLGTTWPFRPGGITTFNERLARALIAQGHEVIIYTFRFNIPIFYSRVNPNILISLHLRTWKYVSGLILSILSTGFQ